MSKDYTDTQILNWLEQQNLQIMNSQVLLINPTDLRAACQIAMSDENYDCPLHGKQEGVDCARC